MQSFQQEFLITLLSLLIWNWSVSNDSFKYFIEIRVNFHTIYLIQMAAVSIIHGNLY